MSKDKKRIVVLTGAGISAESGLKTFRDAGGLWEGHDVMKVASPEGWKADQDLVLHFYNERRKQLNEVYPNQAHFALKKLEEKYEVIIITQNVDDLHERAGSTNVIHLHGSLKSVRSTKYAELRYDWDGDLVTGDVCEKGHQLRPDIVWFGEPVPMIELAVKEIMNAEICVIIGTSMQVYPAASLIGYAPPFCDTYYVDPRPSINYELQSRRNLTVINESAVSGVPTLVKKLLSDEG